MTKPIEGWVLDVNDMIPTTVSDYQDGEVLEVIMKEPHDSLMKYRPVKITFTDATARDLINDYADDGESTFKQLEKMHDYVESLAPELNGYIELDEGQKIQNALKKERERIYERLKELDPHAALLLNEIFGEEK